MSSSPKRSTSGSASSVRRASGTRPAETVRRHAAFVRTLVDEVARATPSELADPVSAQMVEELARLGCRCVELAGKLAALVDEQERAREEPESVPPARCA